MPNIVKGRPIAAIAKQRKRSHQSHHCNHPVFAAAIAADADAEIAWQPSCASGPPMLTQQSA